MSDLLADVYRQLQAVNRELAGAQSQIPELARRRRALCVEARELGASMTEIAGVLGLTHRASVHRILGGGN